MHLQVVRISARQKIHTLTFVEKKCITQISFINGNTELIKIGFTCTLINDEPRPQCVVCSEVLANESLEAGKLKRHLTAKHLKFIDKPMSFFRRLEKELLSQKKTMTKHLTILKKAQKASHKVAYLIAKNKKLHSIGETL